MLIGTLEQEAQNASMQSVGDIRKALVQSAKVADIPGLKIYTRALELAQKRLARCQ